MAYSLKKVWAVMAVSLAAATSLVSADTYNNGPFVGPMNNNCCYDVCPASCNPCGDLAFSIEGLVWRACEDGLAFGTQTTTAQECLNCTPSKITHEVNSRLKEPHFKWDWGFRLGLGYALPCDCWGLQLYWTHYNTHTSSTHDESFITPSATVVGQFFTPAWGQVEFNGSSAAAIDSTTAHWKLKLDLLDVELGRPFCISQCLTLRPHIGVRAVWINQRYNIDNFNTDTSSVTRTLQEVRLKSDFTAAGLRAGLDTQWDLGCGISLYGNAAASIVYGNYDVKSEDDYLFVINDNDFYEIRQKDQFCACRGVTDASIGFRWRTCFCNDTIAMTWNIGWEHHLFFNQNEFEDFVFLEDLVGFDPAEGGVKNPQFHKGDLCFHGVVFGLKLDY